MFKKNISLCVAIFLICIAKSTFAQEETLNNMVSEKYIVEIDFSSWVKESFTVSPDNKGVMYVAQAGDKWFLVVDSKEGKHYDGIVKDSHLFSPDSKRIAYAARAGTEHFVVADGKEGKNSLVAIGGGKIIFDASDSIQYLVIKDTIIYLVEKNIQ